jgi:hypothetical protein
VPPAQCGIGSNGFWRSPPWFEGDEGALVKSTAPVDQIVEVALPDREVPALIGVVKVSPAP